MTEELDDTLALLRGEMRNLEEMLREIHPSSGEPPRLEGIDIAGVELPLAGGCGGDHIVYVDFDRMYDLDGRIAKAKQERPEVARRLERNRHLAGLLIADATGHRQTDSLHVAMLHQAFLSCIPYELELNGFITNGLFENLNTGFFNSVGTSRFITMIYGEISDEGRFRFICAGHPPPVVFSSHFDRFAEVSRELMVSCPPLGMLPSEASLGGSRSEGLVGYKEAFTTNQLDLLGHGDILLLHSDGLSEHGEGAFFPSEVEALLRETKLEPATTICRLITDRVASFAPQEDDVSFVVIKRMA
jgi:serine phosphatase RsbU (regulator of sigma subunit)